MDVEPDPVAERVIEPVAEHRALGLREARRVSVALVETADRAEDVGAVGAGAHELPGQLERLARVLVPGRDLGVGRPDGERPGHVGEAGALDVVREEVADEVVVVRHAAAALVVAVRRLRPVRDDQVVPAAARRGKRLHCCCSEELAGQGLAVHEPAAVGGLRSLEKRGDRGHAGLRRARGAPDAVELPRGLLSPPVVEEALVGDELDPRRPQRVGVRSGNCAGTVARPMPSERTICTVCAGPIS